MVDIIRQKLEGGDDRPELRIRTSRSSDSSEEEEAATGNAGGHPQIRAAVSASVCTSAAAADVAEAESAGAATAGLSRCSSTDSRDSHLSNLTTMSSMSSHLAAEWRNICTVSPTDRLDQPLSPSILTSPDCVRDRKTMDRVVTTTARRVTQLHSFLSSDAERAGSTASAGGSWSGGAHSYFRKGSGVSGEAGSNSNGSIRRVGSKGEDSVGQESTLSDDSLRREESQLTSAAVDEMKVEMEGLEREFLSMHTSSLPPSDSIEGCLSLALSNDIGVDVDGTINGDVGEDTISDGVSYCDDGASNASSSSSARALLDIATQENLPAIPSLSNIAKPHEYGPMASTPNRKLKSNPYENGASPSGVAEFANDEQSSSSSNDSSLFVEDAETPFRLKSKSLLNKFDSTMSVGSGRSDDSSLCQLASPQPLPPSGWAESLAEFAFGTHGYQVQTTISSREDKLRPRTVEGGLFVTASISVVLAILLRTSDVVDVTEQQFYAAMTIIPPLITLFESKIVPHSIDETKVALGVLLGGLVFERVMC